MKEYIIDRVRQTMEENADIRHKGGIIAIPWLDLPRFSIEIPGIQRGRYQVITANSKVGKTKMGEFLFMFQPLKWLKQNPTTNIKPKIFYFSLEMSKEDKVNDALCHYIYQNEKKIYTTNKLLSAYKNGYLNKSDFEIVDRNIPDVKFLEDHVTFIDNIKNPFGIYKVMEDYAESNGDYVYKDMPFKNNTTGKYEIRQVKDYYIPRNPTELVIVLVDHLSLLTPERGGTKHEAMSMFSSSYALKMRDLWKYNIAVIQQQAADSEKPQYTQNGQLIIQKLKPSADGLGDNKLIGRDCDMMLGLFDPNRYGTREYHEYDIRTMGDHYRELSIILNRRGSGNKSVDLFFNGAVGQFVEIPKADDPTMKNVYTHIKQLPT